MISRVPKVLTAIKELHFSAPFDYTDFAELGNVQRCPHFPTRESNLSRFDSPSSGDDDSTLSQGDDSIRERQQENMMDFDEMFDFEDRNYGMMRLSKKFLRLLSKLPDNQLRSFR